MISEKAVKKLCIDKTNQLYRIWWKAKSELNKQDNNNAIVANNNVAIMQIRNGWLNESILKPRIS